jgi:hypothetical protein
MVEPNAFNISFKQVSNILRGRTSQAIKATGPLESEDLCLIASNPIDP